MSNPGLRAAVIALAAAGLIGLSASAVSQARAPQAAASFTAAYAAFQKTGTWPDKTVLVLEIRGAQEHASINKGGRSQSNRMAVEVHVKDTARFKGGWGFYGFSGEQPATLIPQAAACYACHQDHAAVDTTFVQFYPTLLPVSTAKGTLSAAYLAEEKAKPAAK